MGTKTNLRRNHRAGRRGLASFVSFLLLFAFALGQSGTLIALADAGSNGVSRTNTLPVAQPTAAKQAPASPTRAMPLARANGPASLARPATSTVDTGGNVTICHATTSVTNPWAQRDETIAPSGSGVLSGHLDHTGPVAATKAGLQALKDQHIQWGDIVPPFVWDGVTYSLNWSEIGQAIWANECKPLKAAITVTKSCPRAAAVGQEITYTIRVTN